MVDTKKVILGVAGVAAAVAGATAAQASDLPSKTSAPKGPTAAAGNWDGFYVGAGMGMLETEIPYHDDDDENYAVSNASISGFAGYNHTLSSGLVVGAELAYSTGGDGTGTDADEPTYNYSLDGILDAKMRLGMDVGPALIYLTGGVSSVNFTAVSANNYVGWGYNVGVGTQMKLTNNISVGAEALYRSVSNTYHSDSDYGGSNGADGWGVTLRTAYHF